MPKKLNIGLLLFFVIPLAVLGQEQKNGADSIPVRHHHQKPENSRIAYGTGSYYSNKFEGRKTFTDEIFTQRKFTAASNTVPMHNWVKVTNLRNHRSVVVRINDKMHPKNRRLIDLSRIAAEQLGFAGRGLTRVKVEVLGRKRPPEYEKEEELEKKAAAEYKEAKEAKEAKEKKSAKETDATKEQPGSSSEKGPSQ